PRSWCAARWSLPSRSPRGRARTASPSPSRAAGRRTCDGRRSQVLRPPHFAFHSARPAKGFYREMKVTHSVTLDAPVDQVWKVLLDPNEIAACIPGCEGLEPVGENQYHA